MVTIFREIIAHVTRTIVVKSLNIAMAHRRSFPGFQIMELGSLNLFQFSLFINICVSEILMLNPK